MQVRFSRSNRPKRNLHQRIGLVSINELIPVWLHQSGDFESVSHQGVHSDSVDNSVKSNSAAPVDNAQQLFFPSMVPSNH
jgi:hypothetical protein